MDYWHSVARSRLSRRRALAVAGLTGAGAIALGVLGCGDDNSGGASSSTANGLLAKPEDTTKEAKAGGIWSYYTAMEALSFDHLNTARAGSSQADFTYSRLFKFKTGSPDKLPVGEVEGDA